MKCQIGISKEAGRGGRRYMPYAFTEQGISMLSAILHSDIAVHVSIGIKKSTGVDVKIYTYANARLTNADAAHFNAQYPTLTIKKTQAFHDRFLILDETIAYHIGASIKDAGKKCFAITLMDEPELVSGLLNRLQTV